MIPFSQVLRWYQEGAVNHALDWLRKDDEDTELRRLYSCPTGTGKGSMQLALCRALREYGQKAWIISPSLDVIRGYLERTVGKVAGGTSKMHAAAQALGITTPTRLRNRMLKAEIQAPDVLIVDEAHHHIEANQVGGDLFAMCPFSRFIGYTATPYRATPKATALLRDDWGEPWVILDWKEATEHNFAELPSCGIAALVDDDKIAVVNGDFRVVSSTRSYRSRLDALGEVVAGYYVTEGACPSAMHFDKPTMVAVPSTELAHMLKDWLQSHNVPVETVLQETSTERRTIAYERCRNCEAVIVQINVISEGVDLPWLRRLIDAKPTMSPVAWVQQFGRITRPGEMRAEYICTNRNLERFAYLLDGILPSEVIREAQEAFGSVSKRSAVRHLGFEALSRFKVIEVPLANGTTGQMYTLYNVAQTDGAITQWTVLSTPGTASPLVASRLTTRTADGGYSNGKWARSDLPTDFAGFQTSAQRGRLSAKQRAWWERSAASRGLHPDAADALVRRQFQALPVLFDLGERLPA